MELIIFAWAVSVIVAYIAGKHIAAAAFLDKLSRKPEVVMEMLKQIIKINEEQARMEQHNVPDNAILLNTEERAGAVYLFRSEDNQFVAQGNTLDEALKQASIRFPNQVFWLPNPMEDSQTT